MCWACMMAQFVRKFSPNLHCHIHLEFFFCTKACPKVLIPLRYLSHWLLYLLLLKQRICIFNDICIILIIDFSIVNAGSC